MDEFLGDGAAGRLFAVGDVDAMIEGCVSILNDSGQLAEMSQNGRKRVLERYSEHDIMGRYEDLYRRVLETSG
jgi:glycosyltransferase involved in cell wall biosynthesis